MRSGHNEQDIRIHFTEREVICEFNSLIKMSMPENNTFKSAHEQCDYLCEHSLASH